MYLVKPSIEIYESLTYKEYIKTEMLKAVERKARICYKSEDIIDRETHIKFLTRIVNHGHLSVLRHEKISVYIICSRACSHQLVRHGLSSFSQESMRWCDYSKEKFKREITFIIPHYITDIPEGRYTNTDFIDVQFIWGENRNWFSHLLQCENYYFNQRRFGMPQEDARGGLPQDTKTELIMTCNLEQWLNVFKQRCSTHAQIEVRTLMQQLQSEFSKLLSPVFTTEQTIG